MNEPDSSMTDDTTPSTDARSAHGAVTPADPMLRADGGNPLGEMFELVDASRVSDLRWAEDDDGHLYALDQDQAGQERTVVAVDVAAGTAEEVDVDDLDRTALSPVDDVLGRATPID